MSGNRTDFGIGEPAPWFTARTTLLPRLQFDLTAGRPVALCFLGAATVPSSLRVLADLHRARDRFNGENALFLCVSVEPSDIMDRRVTEAPPGIQFIWDFDRAVSITYGVAPPEAATQAEAQYRQVTFVLDSDLRLLRIEPLSPVETHIARVSAAIEEHRARQAASADSRQAPVLTVARVFEPAFCQRLVALFERDGGEDSGFMVEENGLTVRKFNHSFKRRTDVTIGEESVRREINVRVFRRLLPAVRKAYNYSATHIERHLIACYDAESKGHFGPHRDNTTRGTAHRRFAVSIALNEPDYGGGDLCFPEYGPGFYRLAQGSALVFSCSILHQVRPVTSGRRYVLLPFLYDADAQRLRDQNEHLLREG